MYCTPTDASLVSSCMADMGTVLSSRWYMYEASLVTMCWGVEADKNEWPTVLVARASSNGVTDYSTYNNNNNNKYINS